MEVQSAILMLVGVIQLLVAAIGTWVVQTLRANGRSQASLTRSVDRLSTAVLGLEGQGGLARLVDEICDRCGELEKLIPLVANHEVGFERLLEWQAGVMRRVDAAERLLERVRVSP